jgi:hypothetical protein
VSETKETLYFHGIPIVYDDTFAIIDPTPGAASMLIDWEQCPDWAFFWRMDKLRSGEVRVSWVGHEDRPKAPAPDFGISLTTPLDGFQSFIAVCHPLKRSPA